MEQDLAKVWRDLQRCIRQLDGSTVTLVTLDGRRIEHFRPQDFTARSLVHVRGVIDSGAAGASSLALDLSDIQSVSIEDQAGPATPCADAREAQQAMRSSF